MHPHFCTEQTHFQSSRSRFRDFYDKKAPRDLSTQTSCIIKIAEFQWEFLHQAPRFGVNQKTLFREAPHPDSI